MSGSARTRRKNEHPFVSIPSGFERPSTLLQAETPEIEFSSVLGAKRNMRDPWTAEIFRGVASPGYSPSAIPLPRVERAINSARSCTTELRSEQRTQWGLERDARHTPFHFEAEALEPPPLIRLLAENKWTAAIRHLKRCGLNSIEVARHVPLDVRAPEWTYRLEKSGNTFYAVTTRSDQFEPVDIQVFTDE